MTTSIDFDYLQKLRDLCAELADIESDTVVVHNLISLLAELDHGVAPDGRLDVNPADSEMLYAETLAFVALFAADRGTKLRKEQRQSAAKEQSFQQLHQQLLKKSMVLRERTMVDELTGLFNRRYFERSLTYDIERFQRYKRPIGVVLFDVDFFKKINDTYGHGIGDAALRHLAEMAKATIRSADMVARYGGEEFVLLLPETGSEGTAILADRLRKRVETTPLVTESGEVHITISLGVFALEGDFSGTAEDVMRIVDNALYAAKDAGRNCSMLA